MEINIMTNLSNKINTILTDEELEHYGDLFQTSIDKAEGKNFETYLQEQREFNGKVETEEAI